MVQINQDKFVTGSAQETENLSISASYNCVLLLDPRHGTFTQSVGERASVSIAVPLLPLLPLLPLTLAVCQAWPAGETLQIAERR